MKLIFRFCQLRDVKCHCSLSECTFITVFRNVLRWSRLFIVVRNVLLKSHICFPTQMVPLKLAVNTPECVTDKITHGIQFRFCQYCYAMCRLLLQICSHCVVINYFHCDFACIVGLDVHSQLLKCIIADTIRVPYQLLCNTVEPEFNSLIKIPVLEV